MGSWLKMSGHRVRFLSYKHLNLKISMFEDFYGYYGNLLHHEDYYHLVTSQPTPDKEW